jgi:hypothetical protein
MIMKYALINPEGVFTDRSDASRVYRMWPHLGLLSVGTAVEQTGIEVVLWDELVQGPADLESLVEPGDIVGLSLVVSGIERGALLAREAKRLGASAVIAGNDSAIFRTRQLLAPDSPFDAVSTSNDLTCVRDYCERVAHGAPVHDIPGIATRASIPASNRTNWSEVLRAEAHERRRHPSKNSDVFIVPRFGLYSDEYWRAVHENHRYVLGHKYQEPEQVRNALALFAQGCTRTGAVEACSYCTIADVADLLMPEKRYLADLLQALSDFGITHVFNTTDSALEMKNVARALRELGARFAHGLTIYGRAWGMANRPDCIAVWQEIAGERLVINSGFDSGDENLLQTGVIKASLRGDRLNENRLAVKHLKESGAHLHVSFIFGSPGETRESCERTLEFFRWMRGELGSQLQVCESDIYWLNHGAPASRVFHSYEYARSLAALAGKDISRAEWEQCFFRHKDTLTVPDEAEAAWYRFFTCIDLDYARACVQQVADEMREHEGAIASRRYAFQG